MHYSFRGIFPLSSWNNFLWIFEYRKTHLNIRIWEAAPRTEVACILEVLWLWAWPPAVRWWTSDGPGDSLRVHFDWSPVLTQALCEKHPATMRDSLFFLPTPFYLGDNVLRHHHISCNISIIKEETFQNRLHSLHPFLKNGVHYKLKSWSMTEF